MGNSTFPIYIYELIQAVQRYEDEHSKEEMEQRGWCFKQWLEAVPEEHQRLATMLDDLKAHLNVSL